LDILATAVRFQIPELEVEIENIISSHITHQTAFTILYYANSYNKPSLATDSIRVIKQEILHFFEEDVYRQLTKEDLSIFCDENGSAYHMLLSKLIESKADKDTIKAKVFLQLVLVNYCS